MVFSSKIVPSNIRQSIESAGRGVLSEKGTFYNPSGNHSSRNDQYFLRYSVAKSTVTNVGANSKYNGEDNEDSPPDNDVAPSARKTSLIESCKSIKFFVIVLITLLVVASAFVISTTWLGAFIPAISDFSFDVRQGENDKLVMNIRQTMTEAVIVLETAKGQYRKEDLINPASIELSLYRFFQSETNYHGGLPLAVLLGNHTMSYTVLQWGPIPSFIEIGPVMQKIYYCAGLTADYCARATTPAMVMPSFDLSLIISTAEKRPGKPTFTPSYSVSGSLIFVTLVTSWKAQGNQTADSSPISNYLAFAMTTDKLSKYLKQLSQDMSGSKAMIIETSTNYLLAIDNETSILAVQEGATAIRKTPLNIDIKEYRDIGNAIYQHIPNLKSGIECNTYKHLVLSSSYIMLYRMCSEYNMDWVIVVSTPQWDYISPIIYALIAALCGSAIVLGVSVLVGILFSLKIVRPFKNLMLMFESVSRMDLDNILGLTTNSFEFSEMKFVKYQFQEMLKKLKLYRAFIPSHLLQEIEGDQQELVEHSTNNSQLGNSNVKHSHSSGSGSKHTLNSSVKSSQHSSINKFALYIEVKQVSFAGIFIEGLEMWYLNTETNGSKELLSLLSDIFEQVNAASRVSGCHIDTFDNDLIVLSFNSSKDQKNHIEKALSVSQTLMEKLTDVKQSLYKSQFAVDKHRKSHGNQLRNHHLIDGLNFRIAVTSQKVYSGNVGTQDSKFFSVVSSIRKNLDQLVEVAHRLDLSIVFPERIYQKASELYQTRFVDLKELVDDSFLSPSCFLNSSSCLSPPEEEISEPNMALRSQLFTKEAIYELGESNQIENDQEWMYELNHKQKLLKWKKYQEACVAFFSEQYDKALTLFEEFLAERSVKESASLFSARHQQEESSADDHSSPRVEVSSTSSPTSNKAQPALDKPAMNFVRICRMKIENL
ncbi:hypothetical protein C9374_004453 [Naegleria lovaniensis]|uniref:Uncharacterized protein n=1 Tax=Naegleria lovaniensis TaxID=51637 RepID=A0AA88GLD3_NAELO|nr:uncharacterized protein C9374_004453 [Naegleria lovaniensis]KAG2383116.1 hypothetical protein C9374_004453 [Naegleria lovaniensis]